MQYYSALKRMEILSYTTACKNLGYIMLSEMSQSQKDKYCMIPLTLVPKIVNLTEAEG